ncbi:MAG: glycerol-3-phosphate acyltransferase [Chloroflexota bacterium]|jgi:glycerol-3-phosphate acyltransferase PlsY
MEPGIAILAVVAGYLAGSVSFARLVARRVSPEKELTLIRQPIANTDIVFESDSVSATMVRMEIGTRYGCLTAVLDILKVTLPTLLFKLWQPATPYFLIVAVAGLIGHDWPLYHRFKGGRGESAIVGGMLVSDPLGLVVTNVTGVVIGWLAGDVLVLRWAFLILLIPWFWLRGDGAAYVAYAAILNLIYWAKMMPELKQFARILKEGGLSTQEEVAGDMAMGRKLGHFLDEYGAPSLLRRAVRTMRGNG